MVSAAVGAAAALGSAVYGSAASAWQNKKAMGLIKQQRDENRRWYNTRMSQDYTQRADVQAAINKQRELLNEQYRRARATNQVAGGTEHSLAVQKEAANRSLSDTMGNIAAASSEYKDNIERQYRTQDAALNQQQVQNHQQQAAAMAQAASQAVNAATGIAGQSAYMKGAKVTGVPVSTSEQLSELGKTQAIQTKSDAQVALDETIRKQFMNSAPKAVSPSDMLRQSNI